MLVPYSPRDDRLRTIPLVGMTHIPGTVKRSEGRGRPVKVRFIVDSGALYSVLPERVWRRLGLQGKRRAHFELADGTVITRPVFAMYVPDRGYLRCVPRRPRGAA